MNDYCEGCIHYVLQLVVCATDKGGQISYESTCIAEKCIREGKYNVKYKKSIDATSSK
ncbi:hypothetical protein CF095_16365 [Clostridium botulinum]